METYKSVHFFIWPEHKRVAYDILHAALASCRQVCIEDYAKKDSFLAVGKSLTPYSYLFFIFCQFCLFGIVSFFLSRVSVSLDYFGVTKRLSIRLGRSIFQPSSTKQLISDSLLPTKK